MNHVPLMHKALDSTNNAAAKKGGRGRGGKGGGREKRRKRRRRGNKLRTYCRHLQMEDMGDL